MKQKIIFSLRQRSQRSSFCFSRASKESFSSCSPQRFSGTCAASHISSPQFFLAYPVSTRYRGNRISFERENEYPILQNDGESAAACSAGRRGCDTDRV